MTATTTAPVETATPTTIPATELPKEPFETIQDAAAWARERAREHGLNDKRIEEIEGIGNCDQQSKDRIVSYCRYLEIAPSRVSTHVRRR